jgi:hypothetical protein
MTEEEAWDEARRRNQAREPARGFRGWLHGPRYWLAVQRDDGSWTVEQKQAKGTVRSALADFVGELLP